MGVGNPEPFEQALNPAIFAELAMKGVENDVGGDLGQARAKVGAGIQLDHLVSFTPQRGGTFTP